MQSFARFRRDSGVGQIGGAWHHGQRACGRVWSELWRVYGQLAYCPDSPFRGGGDTGRGDGSSDDPRFLRSICKRVAGRCSGHEYGTRNDEVQFGFRVHRALFLLYERNSPLTYAKQINTPLLLIHGELTVAHH